MRHHPGTVRAERAGGRHGVAIVVTPSRSTDPTTNHPLRQPGRARTLFLMSAALQRFGITGAAFFGTAALHLLSDGPQKTSPLSAASLVGTAVALLVILSGTYGAAVLSHRAFDAAPENGRITAGSRTPAQSPRSWTILRGVLDVTAAAILLPLFLPGSRGLLATPAEDWILMLRVVSLAMVVLACVTLFEAIYRANLAALFAVVLYESMSIVFWQSAEPVWGPAHAAPPQIPGVLSIMIVGLTLVFSVRLLYARRRR